MAGFCRPFGKGRREGAPEDSFAVQGEAEKSARRVQQAAPTTDGIER